MVKVVDVDRSTTTKVELLLLFLLPVQVLPGTVGAESKQIHLLLFSLIYHPPRQLHLPPGLLLESYRSRLPWPCFGVKYDPVSERNVKMESVTH